MELWISLKGLFSMELVERISVSTNVRTGSIKGHTQLVCNSRRADREMSCFNNSKIKHILWVVTLMLYNWDIEAQHMSASYQIIPHHSEVAAGCNATLHESVVSIVYNHNMSSNAELNHTWNKQTAITNLLYINCTYTRLLNGYGCVLS